MHIEEELRMKEIAFLEAERLFYEDNEWKEWQDFLQSPAKIVILEPKYKKQENDSNVDYYRIYS